MNEIGNQAEATEALRIVRGLRDPRRDELLAPGWVRAGQGTTRIVLRAPSGAVYKVPCPLYPNWEQGKLHNEREEINFAALTSRGFVPEWHPYQVEEADGQRVPIMAMEYVETDGTQPTNLEELRASLKEVGAEDLHPDNYRVRGGRAILIDAGGSPDEGTPCYLPDHLLGPGLARDLG